MQNIGFSNSHYIIKPPQRSSAVYGALPFAGHPFKYVFLQNKIWKWLRNQPWIFLFQNLFDHTASHDGVPFERWSVCHSVGVDLIA